MGDVDPPFVNAISSPFAEFGVVDLGCGLVLLLPVPFPIIPPFPRFIPFMLLLSELMMLLRLPLFEVLGSMPLTMLLMALLLPLPA